MVGLEIATEAPDFTLPRSLSKNYSLSDYRGRRAVIVSFNALVFTGGSDWGVEATLRNFERDHDAFMAAQATILAITGDSMYSNEAFSRWLGGLRFPILADFLPRGAVSRQWNAWSEDREHPRNVTLVVDQAGIVRHSEHHAKGGVPDNAALLRVVASLAANT